MKTLVKNLTQPVKEWLYLSGYDENLVRYHMKNSLFAVLKVTGKKAIEREGVDKNYPYVILNPYGFKIKQDQDQDKDQDQKCKKETQKI